MIGWLALRVHGVQQYSRRNSSANWLRIWAAIRARYVATWSWDILARRHPDLRHGMENYFAEASNDPASAAYQMVTYFHSPREWAGYVIEQAQQEPPSAAADMVRYCTAREWAEGVIEHAQTGNPAFWAYYMARHLGSPREWAEGVIERAQTGNPTLWAVDMVKYCGSAREWADRVAARMRQRCV